MTKSKCKENLSVCVLVTERIRFFKCSIIINSDSFHYIITHFKHQVKLISMIELFFHQAFKSDQKRDDQRFASLFIN